MAEGSILALPLVIQVSFGAGYLGYLSGYAGLRKHHTATDVVFRSAVFGLPALSFVTLPIAIWITILPAIASSLICGVLWRAWLADWVRDKLRDKDLLWADDIPTAWLSVAVKDTGYRYSQVAVELNDGRTLLCGDTKDFVNSPHGPCVFGLEGDIALYVTDERRADGEWIKHPDVSNAAMGDNLTYVPASAIRRVEMRLWSKDINGKVSVEAAKA